jgi:hypothetical protein
MREFNALRDYPQPQTPRYVSRGLRTVKSRIIASYRDERYYDGDRNNGYGGFHYDGRWKKVAEFMIHEYNLTSASALLQVGCEKGFLLHDFHQFLPSMKIRGCEVSDYAIRHSMETVKEHIQQGAYTKLPFLDREFDFIIAIGVIYPLALGDAISALKEIQRVGKGRSFITLGAYRSDEGERLFKMWTLLGSTIFHVDEWIEVLKEAGYTGDYAFVTSDTLNLKENEE